jgi:hypothetical protein
LALLRRGAVMGMCAALTVGVWVCLAPAPRDDSSITRGGERVILAAGVDSGTPVAQPRRRRRHRPTSVYDGIPWDTAAVALLLSAAIGAAGAKIYVGITGPDD